MDSTTIPIIDISAIDTDYVKIAREITEACQVWGFFFIKNHSIPLELVNNMFAFSKKYNALPISERNKYPINKDRMGYVGPGDDYHKDEKSVMWMGGLPGELKGNPGVHPIFDDYIEMIDEYKRQCTLQCVKLLRCFAISLGLEENFFAKHHVWGESPSLCVMLHYPAKDAPPPPSSTSTRMSAHTDGANSLTILFQQAPGLEVLSPKGEWVRAPAPGFDHALINIGDMLQYWSGGSLKATLHRVTQETLPWDRERYSIAFFSEASPSTLLNPVSGDLDIERMAAQDGKSFRKGMTAGEYGKEEMKVIYGPDFFEKQAVAAA